MGERTCKTYLKAFKSLLPSSVGINCKRPIPICRLFFKIDLLTDIAALCLTDFIDWRYIHSLVGIFDPACELLPPWTKELLYTCVLLPLYLLSDLFPPSPPSQTKCTVYTDSVCLRGRGGELCCVDHILQEFYTLFLTRCRTYNFVSYTTPNKMTSENDIKGLVSLKFLRPCLVVYIRAALAVLVLV